jgi:hypothetical protein
MAVAQKREVPGLTLRNPTREFALYPLGQAVPAAAASCPRVFSPASYSRYKYGSVAATEAFARALVTALDDRHPELTRAPRLLLTSSPYAFVPTAATTLARSLQQLLNVARAGHGLPAAPLMKVDRIRTSAGDYGTLSAQARDRHMAANPLSFRRFRPDQLQDAHLLVVDDVRVTGAHQRCLMRASEELPLAARAFLYIASFAAPASAGFDPTLEDVLNHAAIKTLGDLAEIVQAGDFAWNVRACKFILDPANHDELPRFLGRMPSSFVRELHRNSRRDGYWRMARYTRSHALVRAELSRRLRTRSSAGTRA